MALEKFDESFRKEVVKDNTKEIKEVLGETNEDLENLLDQEIQDKVSEISKETLENLNWKQIQTEDPNSDIRKLIGAIYFMEKKYNKREISFEGAKEDLIRRKEKFDKSNEEYAKGEEKPEEKTNIEAKKTIDDYIDKEYKDIGFAENIIKAKKTEDGKIQMYNNDGTKRTFTDGTDEIYDLENFEARINDGTYTENNEFEKIDENSDKA